MPGSLKDAVTRKQIGLALLLSGGLALMVGLFLGFVRHDSPVVVFASIGLGSVLCAAAAAVATRGEADPHREASEATVRAHVTAAVVPAIQAVPAVEIAAPASPAAQACAMDAAVARMLEMTLRQILVAAFREDPVAVASARASGEIPTPAALAAAT